MSEKIRAIIVDDEKNSLLTLQKLLEKYCPKVEVIGMAQNVRDSISKIDELKPDLVFLDIAMPDGDGFEVLDKVEYKLFEVIFTTAYDQYALRAFDFAALHYLLKPINFQELQQAVDRFEKVHSEDDFTSKMEVLKTGLSHPQEKIVLPSLEGMNIVEIASIIRCESDNNYTIFHLKQGGRIVVSKSLNNFERLLDDSDFVRIHSKHLVNLKYIKKYVRGRGGYVVFEDGTHADVSLGRLPDFLKRLKEYAKTIG